MPTRMIRDGILTSERINALSERAELFYRRLMSVVDDYGRFSANPTLLCTYCYPLKRTTREETIKGHLAECVRTGVVMVYEVDGKPFLEVQDFGQRVQSKSKYPAPDGSAVIHGESPEKTALVGVGVVDVIEDGKDGAEPPAAPPPAITFPLNTGEEYPITADQALEFGSLYPAVDVQAQLRKMRGWLLANPANRKTKAGILRFVTRWLGDEQDKAGRSGAGSPPATVKSGKPAGPSETKLEAAISWARHQHHVGSIDATERDRLIAEATNKHRGNT